MKHKINNQPKRPNLYLFVTLFLAVMILLLSVVPGFGGGINSGVPIHSSAYFVLSLSIALYFRTRPFSNPLVRAAFLAGMYGAFIEFVQFFIPYRQFELLDILIDFSAAFIAIVPHFILIKKKLI
jgi:hypothetical protein